MSKIKLEDFVDNVERNRQKLVKYCRSNYKQLDDNASLDEATTIATSFEQAIPEGKVAVKFIDLFNNYIETQVLDIGSPIRETSIIPNPDPDLVDFDGWVAEGSLDSVEDSLIAVPTYVVKPDENGRRYTIMVCELTENSGLTLTLSLQARKTAGDFVLDWGDGTIINQSLPTSKTTFTHTFEEYGKYIVKMYCSEQFSKIYSSSSSGFFDTQNKSKALSKFYTGDNFCLIQNLFYYCTNLQVASLSKTMPIYGGGPTYVKSILYYCDSIKVFYLPILNTDRGDTYYGTFASMCRNLKYFINSNIKINNHIYTQSAYTYMEGCNSLDLGYNFLKYHSSGSNLMSGDNYGTKYIKIPNSFEYVKGSSSYSFLGNAYGLEILVVENSVMDVTNFGKLPNLKQLVLPQDWKHSLNLAECWSLTDECLVDIANKLALLENESLTISFGTYLLPKINKIKVDEFGSFLGVGVYDGISLVEFITNKNWTVS